MESEYSQIFAAAADTSVRLQPDGQYQMSLVAFQRLIFFPLKPQKAERATESPQEGRKSHRQDDVWHVALFRHYLKAFDGILIANNLAH